MADIAQTPVLITTESPIQAVDIHRYIACASDLGFKPGEWPLVIATRLGNKLPFLRDTLDAYGAVYVQSFGCLTLTIYND